MKKLAVNSDTFINEKNKGATNGGSGSLVLSDAGNKKYALVHIPIPDLAGAVVQAAHLHVFLKGSNWASGNVIKADLLTAGFKENDTWHTYNASLPSLPSGDQATEALGGAHNDGHEVTIDLSTLLADAAAASAFYGLLLSVSTSNDRVLYSSEAQSRQYRPFLVLSYSQAPPAPDNLHPNAGASAAKPRLSWDSADQTSFQVQISATENGGSPDADSGQIFSTGTQLDTSDAALITFAGIADTASTSWRVRVWNDVGAVSQYSEWMTWERHVYGAVAISTPAADGDSVDATTPSIGWTTGNTEGQYRVLEDISGYDSGIVTGNNALADSAEIPKGFVKNQGTVYTVRVRVWDAFTRDAPGEQQYVEATRTFVYTPTVATAPVDTLFVADEGPFILLAWTRSSVPDSFVIFANGIHVASVYPADVAVADTGDEDFEYRYMGAIPGVAAEYEVVSHDDLTGDSLNNPTGSATLDVKGLWLVIEGNTAPVQLLGKDPVDMALGSDGATYYPLGARAPIRITNRIRGWEGTVSGTIITSELRDDALHLRSIPAGKNLIRLIYGSFNFPVDLGNIKTSEWPSSSAGPTYQFSAEFVQTGEPWPLDEEVTA